MWPFKRQDTPHELHVTENDLELLRDHGLASGSNSFITMVFGIKDKRIIVGDIGRILPTLVVSCTQCEEPASWGKGDSVTEKHWNIDEHNPGNTTGLNLTCFYGAFTELLNLAWTFSEGGESETGVVREREGRLALVGVELRDLLSVQLEPIWCAPISIKTRKLKVLDTVDQLRQFPQKSLPLLNNALLDRSEQSKEWPQEWHRLLDAMQPLSWREFLAKFTAITERLGVS